jgi:hypothetical protein
MTNPAPAKPDGEHTPIPWYCDVTGNLVGTDTIMIGAAPCNCQGCRAFRVVNSYPRYEQMREALADLVNVLDKIHADPNYQAVWQLNQLHHGPYCGPQYDAELNRARKALADGTGE